MKLFQNTFGAPSNKVAMAVTFMKKPKARTPPEPILSREAAPLFLELELKKGEWRLSFPWQPYKSCTYAKTPEAIIVIHGRDITPADQAASLPDSPWHEIAAAAEAVGGNNPLSSLPKFLESMQSGTRDEKIDLILKMHKRMYHKESEELKKLLHKAGVPLSALSLVQEAVDSCSICANWRSSKAKPVLKVRQAPRFNHTVYCDLAFFSDCIVFVACDESTRFSVLAVVEYKDETSLENIFRRHWIALFGPPRVFRCDKESAFAGESYGLYLERYGTQREINIAEQSHSWFGIIDRCIQLLRVMYPKLNEELIQEYIVVEPQDVVAEIMFALSSQFVYGDCFPYEVLFLSLIHI